MTWEEKLYALKELTVTRVEMRIPGDWYVSAYGRRIGGYGLLVGAYGEGGSPQFAVEDDWSLIVTDLPEGKYIRVKDKNYRWNGFMWKEQP